MGRCIVAGGKPDMAAPVTGILLSSIAEGSIVKLNESGSPVEFYVAKHDYESALNGTGRTLLVRKDCYDNRVWHSSDVNAYAVSNIDAWLNSLYKNLLDSTVQEHIGTTEFYYTPGNGNNSIAILQRSVFILSATELSISISPMNTEGSKLPIASTLRKAYLNGSPVAQWSRTPSTDGNNSNVAFLNSGGGGGIAITSVTRGSRPCFTLPETSIFDKNTLLFKGVA